MTTDRRTFLKAAGVLAVVGAMPSLAGCTGTLGQQGSNGPRLPNEPNYKGYLDDTSNYDYTRDERGTNAVTVQVGAEGNMGEYAFDPAAVAVSPHTMVTWEWTGGGGDHNVVADEGTFNSGPPVAEAGTTFEYTFDRPGVYKYVCEPHEAMGMKGAVFVALAPPDTGTQ